MEGVTFKYPILKQKPLDTPDGMPNVTVSFKVGSAGGLWAIVHNPDGSQTAYRLVAGGK